jgi:hypothetical protein
MKMERNVEYHHITQIPNPAFEVTTSTRKRKATTSPNTSISSESTSESTIFEEEPLDVILERGWRNNQQMVQLLPGLMLLCSAATATSDC